MKKVLLSVLCAFLLCACAHGPVYVAKNESEAIRSVYEDPALEKLYNENKAVLKDVYTRYTKEDVSFCPAGLGFGQLKSKSKERLNYLTVLTRPQEIMYKQMRCSDEDRKMRKELKCTGDERFSDVLQKYVPKYLKQMKASDVDRKDIDGLAFGVYWPVRDVCDTYGGFVEYVIIYFARHDARDLLEGSLAFEEAIQNAEIVTSLDEKPAASVKPVFKK